MEFIYNDGGRSQYYDAKDVGDCVTRAYAIVTGRDYKDCYDELYDASKQAHLKRHRRSPRNGVYKNVYAPVFEKAGAVWTPTMEIGSGCKVHLNGDEFPGTGRYIARLSKHLAAVIDGAVHDTHDPSRDGTRCVYGYWRFGE